MKRYLKRLSSIVAGAIAARSRQAVAAVLKLITFPTERGLIWWTGKLKNYAAN